jgi:hypothetical protein
MEFESHPAFNNFWIAAGVHHIIYLNSFQAIAPYMGQKRGPFYGGVSPSKIGLIAPYWEPVQALSKARVFLLG